jgi:hypothetical protein
VGQRNQAHDWRDAPDGQARVASRQQALHTGLTTEMVRRRLALGRWRRLQRGAYATFSGPAPRQAELWAALLRAGPGATLSHQTAAELHGLTDQRSEQVHITVPTARNPARYGKIPGVVVHRSGRIEVARHPVLFTAADSGRGNGSRPGRNGAGLRRGIRVDMPSGRTAAYHGAALAGGGRGPQENALADRGHRRPGRGGGRNSLAARVSLRDRGRTSPRASPCHPAGQAPPRGENHLHRQLVQRIRRMRRSRRHHRPSRRRTLE